MFGSRLTRAALAALPALALAAPLATAPATAAAPSTGTATFAAAAPSLDATTVRTGFEVPWDIAFLPDGKMVVTERPGRIRVYSSGAPGGSLLQTLKVPDIELGTGEAGLMGVAVDTDFAAHPYVYVCASREYSGSGGWVNQVLRYSVRSSGSWSGPKVLLGGMRANRVHNGCSLEMDDAGHLWVGMGDGGTESRAQDRDSLNGKILRITRNGGTPSGNPVIGGFQDVVYSMGHRNPQGIAFQPGTNRVYDVEHGPGENDEVNLLEPGGNYGWPCVTGADVPYHPDTVGCEDGEDYLDSAWTSGNPTIATSGGTFLRGAQWGDYEGDLAVSVLKDEQLRIFDVDDDGTIGESETFFDGDDRRLRAAVSGPGGQLYLTTSDGNDRVIRVSPAAPRLSRLEGANRYEVAAEVSQETYPDGVSDVVVATGRAFPDALAGSAAGGRLGMPVLLTQADTVPAATRAELRRLDPEHVWVLGGETSVTDPVFSELGSLSSDGTATRIGGPNRYTVAAGLSQEFYDPGVPAVFIASGEVFADALSASPAAAKNGAPLLLAKGGVLPTATGEALKRLAPQRIYLLGGENTIPASITKALRHNSSAPIERLDGRNRYEVARTIAERFWTTADVYVASGETFPDGLTGGAAAGHRDAALLLARAGSVPDDTGQEMLRLAPRTTTLVGGPVSLSPGVETTLGRLAGTR